MATESPAAATDPTVDAAAAPLRGSDAPVERATTTAGLIAAATDGIDGLPLADQVSLFAEAHRRLSAHLAELEP